jgi:hypothetical protein
LQKEINALNLKLSEVGQHGKDTLTKLQDKLEDLDMRNSFDEQVFGILAQIETEINGSSDDLEQCLVDRKKELIAHLNKVVNEYN